MVSNNNLNNSTPLHEITCRLQGHRLNSPNDLAFSKRGDAYFTDPPYGLPRRQEDSEFVAHGFSGVYRVSKEVIEAARASDDVAAEPELVEKGTIRRDARKSCFVLGSGQLCVLCCRPEFWSGRGPVWSDINARSGGRPSVNTDRLLVLWTNLGLHTIDRAIAV